MKHFSEEDWADFVRDLVAPEMRMTMQQHINEGCNQCEATLRLWQKPNLACAFYSIPICNRSRPVCGARCPHGNFSMRQTITTLTFVSSRAGVRTAPVWWDKS